ncbi:MAG: hypothetical protein ACLFQB_02990 [Chitinispirillaceae bacterium]
MLKLHPVKAIQGKVEVPANPELLYLAALSACATGLNLRIPGIKKSAVLEDVCRSLENHATTELNDSVLAISPVKSDDPALLLKLPRSLSAYRTMYLFMGLGMGKTVVSPDASQKRIEAWKEQGKHLGIKLEQVGIAQSVGLRLEEYTESSLGNINEENTAALLSFLLGRNESRSFTISFFLSNPLRHLSQALGLPITVKSASAEKKNDPLMQRIRFLQQKKKIATTQNQSFTVTVDFTSPEKDRNVDISLPGDDILASALVSAKCLIPKGSLVISNVPLESWASQCMGFIRKMGCKLSIQENSRTSFGSAGMVTIQKTDLTGRKVRCSPLYQFTGQLPCMAVTAAFAKGQSVFRELEELRLDEPDGIDLLEQCLRTLGVRHGEMPDGIVMEGARDFDGFDLNGSLEAHIAVAFSIAGLKCMGETTISDEHLSARWPEFEELLNKICEFRSQ